MKLGHLEIFVTDSDRARNFYRDVLGFEVGDVQGPFVWLVKDGLEVLLRPGRKCAEPATYQQAASALVLYTDDLERTVSELAERGLAMRGTDGSPGCLTFTDPDGNWFQLVDPKSH